MFRPFLNNDHLTYATAPFCSSKSKEKHSLTKTRKTFGDIKLGLPLHQNINKSCKCLEREAESMERGRGRQRDEGYLNSLKA
jgi:hypothetical protein